MLKNVTNRFVLFQASLLATTFDAIETTQASKHVRADITNDQTPHPLYCPMT